MRGLETAAVSGKPSLYLHEIKVSLDNLNENYATSLSRMESALDRILGSVPSSLGKEQERGGNSAVSILRDAVMEAEIRAAKLSTLVDRLETLG